ncbi:MAG: hypothetical protein AAF688_05200 [Bacteroidota bacterium]
MNTLNETQRTRIETITRGKIIKSCLAIIVLLMTGNVFAQEEVEFDIYTNSVTKATQYLLADDVALRDCASVQCEQLTTIDIGTSIRLLAKSESSQTINRVKSRWYKIKMGPQVGWIWGGLISQKTLVSQVNPEIKFVFGEAGMDYKGYKRFQIRAVKNGEEIDKIFVKSDNLHHSKVALVNSKNTQSKVDVISLFNDETKQSEVTTNAKYVTFKNNKLAQVSSLLTMDMSELEKANYAYICNFDKQD